MKNVIITLLILLGLSVGSASAQTTWSIGYYYPDSQNEPMPVSAIQWSKITHVYAVGAAPQSDGSLMMSASFNTFISSLVTNAHANSVKVILTLTNVGSGTDFPDAEMGTCSSGTLQNFVTNIMSVVNTDNLDGVDIDDEDGMNQTAWINTFSCLRTALGSKVLTATLTNDGVQIVWSNTGPTPVCGTLGWNSTMAGYLDRVGLITYDQGNPNNGDPYTWFNAPLGSDSNQFLWSIKYIVQAATNCNIPTSKMTIGIPFYIDLYSINTAPRQTQNASSSLTQIGYQDFAPLYGATGYTFDSTAAVPWKAVGSAGGNPAGYVSAENTLSLTDKINYVTSNSLGGWFIWVLGWDYIAANSPNQALLNVFPGGSGPSPTKPSPPTHLQVSPF